MQSVLFVSAWQVLLLVDAQALPQQQSRDLQLAAPLTCHQSAALLLMLMLPPLGVWMRCD
jgi:hypothetical protein